MSMCLKVVCMSDVENPKEDSERKMMMAEKSGIIALNVQHK